MNLSQKIAELEEMQRAERRAYREQQAAAFPAEISALTRAEGASPLSAGATPAKMTARETVRRDKLNRDAAEGCIRQIMQDLDNGDRDYQRMLLYAAEALDRATGGGDSYFKRLEYHLEQARLRDQAPPSEKK